MKLHYTQHALQRLAKRQLQQEWIGVCDWILAVADQAAAAKLDLAG